ncbi:MAG: FHA domain-containing protein [Candidatus Saccharimonas sp.]|nr:FHA domain-containing protein [Planctomycetaceae bacterium]
MAELIIHAGKLQGKRLVLPEREIVVGRDEDCQLRLTSSLVSRRHCILDIRPDGIWVRDLASQNGTYVNDVAVTEPLLLRAGDILRIGAALFQVPEAVPQPKTKKAAGKISDADIADWLTEDDPTNGPKESDTTVIQGRAAAKTETATVDASPAKSDSSSEAGSSVFRAPTAGKPAHRTIKEEAAEIIRKHWEAVRSKQGE